MKDKYIQFIKKFRKIKYYTSEMRKADCNLFIVFMKFVYYYLFFEKKIIAFQGTRIRHIKNIKMSKDSILFVGISYRGFLDKSDKTVLNIRGSLELGKRVNIARGARITVCEGGRLILKNGCSINSFTKITCTKQITIDEGTGIGWDCEIMDGDLHKIWFGKIIFPDSKEIYIGKHVLVTKKVLIQKGVSIADGCIISAGSILTGKIKKTHCMVMTINKIKIIPNCYWDKNYWDEKVA